VRGQHLEAKVGGNLEVVRVIERTAHAQLDRGGRVDEAFFQRTPKGCAVVVRLSEYGFVQIQVRIKMQQAYLAVLGGNGAQFGKGDGVVAAKAQRHCPGFKQGLHELGDGGVGRFDVTGHNIDVAKVAAGQLVENIDFKDHVVGLDHARNMPDGRRPEARTRAVGTARIKGNAENRKIHALGVVHTRHAHEAAGVAETWGRRRAGWLHGSHINLDVWAGRVRSVMVRRRNGGRYLSFCRAIRPRRPCI